MSFPFIGHPGNSLRIIVLRGAARNHNHGAAVRNARGNASPRPFDMTNHAAHIRYGCVCSGISAPTLAARSLGWQTVFFSEIEKFPRAVLKHHYPDIPRHHDFTTIQRCTYGTVDALVGGTPCQSFSVAGKRLGLDDPRGNLALEYVALGIRLDALWLAFENVPGLLSSGEQAGEDFAALISAATGYEYPVPRGGWRNAGIAEGNPDRWGIAWRVLDAEYFGVPQRRRRVFVIGYRGNWRPAAAVLLEPESMRGYPPPRRQAGQRVAALTATGVGTCGADDNQAQAGHLLSHGFGGGNCSGPINVAATLTAKGVRQDFEVETFIAHSLRGEGFDASEDGTGRGTPIVPVAFAQNTRDEVRLIGADGAIAGAVAAENGMKQQTYLAYPINTQMALRGADTSNSSREGVGVGEAHDPAFTLQANHSHAVAVSIRGREGGATAELSGDANPALRASQGGGDKPHILLPSAVRRLTPEECEALQGFPRGFTRIPWKKKPAEQCPDGPRYKAIGNSMAVPCVRWVFERLDFVHHALMKLGGA